MDTEKLLNALNKRYKKAVSYDVGSDWRLGFEVAQGVVIDFVLEEFGYDPKQVGRNGEALVKRLIKEQEDKRSVATMPNSSNEADNQNKTFNHGK